jgi:release factor glutamine methyltransferase
MDAGGARARVRAILADAGVPDTGFEADQIICREIGSSRASLHAHPEAAVSAEVFSRAEDLAARRAGGEPLAYVLGSAFFCGREFSVDGTLIPRPETEIMTSIADGLLKERAGHAGLFADWCAGSGCIAVTLLLENPGWSCVAVDSSADALRTATENAARHGVAERMTPILCRSPEESGVAPESLSLVVSNPPYIPTRDIPSLEKQVRDFEPLEALDGGPDGLDVCRALIRGTPPLMEPGAHLLIETGGGGQADEAVRLGHELWDATNGPDELKFIEKFSDHRGIGRFILWQKPYKN